MRNKIVGLKKNELFKGLSDRGFEEVIYNFQIKEFAKGKKIYRQGDEINQLLIILEGSLEISNTDLSGNKRMVAILKEHEVFAESVALSSNSQTIFDLTALTNLRVLSISTERFLSLNNTVLLRNMIHILANKNAFLTHKLECINKITIQERMYEVLKYYYHKQKHPTIVLPYNKTQLSDYLCVNRSSLTREVKKMENSGFFTNHLNTYNLNLNYFETE